MPADTGPEFTYVGLAAFYRCLHDGSFDEYRFVSVSGENFSELMVNRQTGIKYRVRHYDAELEHLVVSTAFHNYEPALVQFDWSMLGVLCSKGWSMECRGSDMHMADVEPFRCREPDRSWAPEVPERASVFTWPTLVLEVGVSQSMESLREAKDWWFTHSCLQVIHCSSRPRAS